MNIKEMLIGIFIALGIGIFISPFASSFPDGLEWVAGQLGFLELGKSIFKHSPIADYLFPGIVSERFATAISGFLGTLIVFVLGWILFRLMLFKRTDKTI